MSASVYKNAQLALEGFCKGKMAGGFNDDGTQEAYDMMLNWLRDVLANARPGGKPFWGNQGVTVYRWIHYGTVLVTPPSSGTASGEALGLTLDTPEDLRIVLQRAGAQ